MTSASVLARLVNQRGSVWQWDSDIEAVLIESANRVVGRLTDMELQEFRELAVYCVKREAVPITVGRLALVKKLIKLHMKPSMNEILAVCDALKSGASANKISKEYWISDAIEMLNMLAYLNE